MVKCGQGLNCHDKHARHNHMHIQYPACSIPHSRASLLEVLLLVEVTRLLIGLFTPASSVCCVEEEEQGVLGFWLLPSLGPELCKPCTGRGHWATLKASSPDSVFLFCCSQAGRVHLSKLMAMFTSTCHQYKDWILFLSLEKAIIHPQLFLCLLSPFCTDLNVVSSPECV